MIEALASLAEMHASLGVYDSAFARVDEALVCTRRLYGDASPQTIESRSSLANNYTIKDGPVRGGRASTH